MARKIRKVAPPAFALRGTIYHPVALTFDVHSDLFDAGRHPEDGSPMEGEAFYVVATAPDGKRWQHKSSWAFAPCGECIAHFSFGEPPEDDASDAENGSLWWIDDWREPINLHLTQVGDRERPALECVRG